MGATLLKRPYSPPSLMGGYGTRTPAGILIPSGFAVSDDAFSPLDLSPVLWLDASQESGSDGAAILPTDKSGNGVVITQATEANRPTLEVAEINGRNSFGWNGTSQYLDVALSAAVLPCVMVAVVNLTNFAASHNLQGRQAAGPSGVGHFAIQTTGKQRTAVDATNAAADSDTALTGGQTAVVAVRVATDGSVRYFLNGIADGTTTVADTSPAAGNIRIGANNIPGSYALGQMPELIRYHSELSDADIVRLMASYLMPKWGVS